MDQAVDHRPLTAEVQFRSQDSHCEFCCGQSGTGMRYSPVLASFPGNIILPIFDLIILHLHVLPEVQVDEIWVTSERNAVSEIVKHGK